MNASTFLVFFPRHYSQDLTKEPGAGPAARPPTPDQAAHTQVQQVSHPCLQAATQRPLPSLAAAARPPTSHQGGRPRAATQRAPPPLLLPPLQPPPPLRGLRAPWPPGRTRPPCMSCAPGGRRPRTGSPPPPHHTCAGGCGRAAGNFGRQGPCLFHSPPLLSPPRPSPGLCSLTPWLWGAPHRWAASPPTHDVTMQSHGTLSRLCELRARGHARTPVHSRCGHARRTQAF